MTLPESDAQSSRFPFYQQPNPVPAPPYSITPALPHSAPNPKTPQPFTSNARLSNEMDDDRSIDFATHSWDLATGGLKTLTAKRELPSLLERRPTEKLSPDTTGIPRNYTFLLIVLVCLVLMLISGGVVLFVMLQP